MVEIRVQVETCLEKIYTYKVIRENEGCVTFVSS